MTFTGHALGLISDKIKELTECQLANIYDEFPNAKTWLTTFGLKVIFQNSPPAERRALTLAFIRRVEAALLEYSAAREQIQFFCQAKLSNPQWSPYYRALHHLEIACAMLYQVYDFSRKALGEKYFTKGDGSPLDRLNSIYNSYRHDSLYGQEIVWITNDGIETGKVKLLFSEFENLAREYARIAEMILNDGKVVQHAVPDGLEQPAS